MSDIHYVRKHHLTVAQAKKMVQKAADSLADEYDLESEWDGDMLHFSRSGIHGSMAVTAHEVTLHVKLGFLLSAFRHKFEEHIERNLDKALGSAAAGTAKVAKAAKAAKKSRA
jgi:putative polyhydroxyalkanoate system protein